MRDPWESQVKPFKIFGNVYFVGNHCWNNDTMGKYQRSLSKKENPFIDPEGWKEFLLDCKTNMEQMIAENI